MAPLTTPEEIQEVARRAAPDLHDSAAQRQLRVALEEYVAHRPVPFAPFRATVDGVPYSTFFQAYHAADRSFDRLELEVVGNPPPSAWEFLVPFHRLVLEGDGHAEIHAAAGESSAPESAQARVLLREGYTPRRGRSRRGTPALHTVRDGVARVRETGTVPFAIAILLYRAKERTRIELDLVDSALRPDLRAGHLAPERLVHRSSRIAHWLDAYLASAGLPVHNARALEFLFESDGLSSLDLAEIFGSVRELATTTLDGLAARRLAMFDRTDGAYRIRLEAFRPPEERLSEPRSPAAVPNPALRTSVAELLAAADSRATCPLCGDPVPPGHSGLLCARCQAEVGAGTGGP